MEERRKEILKRWGKVDPSKIRAVSPFGLDEPLEKFLSSFGIKRMLVIDTDPEGKKHVLRVLKKYARDREMEFKIFNASGASVEDVRGQIEIVWLDGRPYHQRKKLSYWPENRGLIVVEGVDQETDIEVLRAFLYVAAMPYSEDRLQSDQLPYGSGFVFLAYHDFPVQRFASITDYFNKDILDGFEPDCIRKAVLVFKEQSQHEEIKEMKDGKRPMLKQLVDSLDVTFFLYGRVRPDIHSRRGNAVRIRIYRGTHEIGGSCVELQSGDSRIIIDLGLPLVEKDGSHLDSGKLHLQAGVELVNSGILLDIRGLYAWDTECRWIDALFLSHAHMDHYGLVNFISPDVPVYSGEATRRLMELTTMFCPFGGIGGKPTTFANGIPVYIGEFRVTPFLVDHSAFDAYAFLIEAEGKSVFYSGDFREHGRKTRALQAIVKALLGKPVDVMLLEGTLFGRPNEKIATENELEEDLVRIIGNKNDISLACFSGQNIDRLVTFYRAALRCEKIFVVDVYTAVVLDALRDFARIPYPSSQYSNLRVFFSYWLSKRLSDSGHVDMLYRFKRFKITRRELE